MVVLDASVINIALPRMQQELGFSDGVRGWAVTAYAVTFGGPLLLGGRIADYAGRKQTLLASLIGFAVASLIGGLATGPVMLIAARALQGVFAAALAPAALSLVAVTFTEPRERARAFAVFAAAQGSGGAIGLLLGGVLTDALGWRWSLFINVPIALVALVLGLPTITRSDTPERGRYDVLGAVLATLGTASLVGAFSAAGETDGWTTPTPYLLIVTTVVLIGLFVHRQRRTPNPLLPLHVVTNRARGGAFLVGGLTMAGMLGMFLLLPYYLQDHLSYSPLATGLMILPFSIALIAASLLVPRLMQRISSHAVLRIGMVVATVAMAALAALIALPGALVGIIMASAVMGVGIGMVFTPLNADVVTGVDPADVGVTSAMLNVSLQVGGAIGVAVLNSVYVLRLASDATGTPGAVSLPGLQLSFTVAACLFALAVVVATTMLRAKARRH